MRNDYKMSRKVLIWQSLILLFFALMLSGCATILAPSYDKALVDGLTSVNTSVMEFLAFVSGGTEKDTFSERKEKYANLIGRLDALELQANARPAPKNMVSEKVNDFLNKRGVPILDDTNAPSATAVSKISKTLVKMRDTDQKQGVTATEVQAFKNQICTYMDQALTYENFLKR